MGFPEGSGAGRRGFWSGGRRPALWTLGDHEGSLVRRGGMGRLSRPGSFVYPGRRTPDARSREVEEDRIRELVSPDRARSRGVLEQLLAAARAVGDTEGEGVLLQRLAQLEFALGNAQAADELFRQARETATAAGDSIGAARALQGRADVANLRGRFDEALAAFAEAGEALREAGEATGALTCGLGTAQALLALGRAADAVATVRELSASDAARDNVALACDCETLLGEIAEEREDSVTACLHYRRALALAEESGDRLRIASGCGRLAGALLASGDAREAEQMALDARALHGALGVHDLEALDLWNLGDALVAQGRVAEAREALGEALGIYTDRGLQAQAEAIAAQLAGLPPADGEDHPTTG
jgi:tetratricopeptide (TPR) repeat protein